MGLRDALRWAWVCLLACAQAGACAPVHRSDATASRRIQEAVTDPISDNEGEVESEEEPTYTYNTITMREYVWSPHGTDMLLAQFELLGQASGFAQPWFGVHDHSADLVAVVDSDGTVREQRSYSPYGELLYVDTFSKASGGSAPSVNPTIKLGHDGLFFDRFDANILTPPHAVGAKGVYYNVNRSYSPHLGRFLQSDPNASGTSVSAYGMYARTRLSRLASADIETMLYDGFNLYQAYGCNPQLNEDGAGLFFGGLAGTAFSIGMGSSVQGHYTDSVIDTGTTFATFVIALTEGFGGDQEALSDWVTDWSLPDDLFDRPVESDPTSLEDTFGSGAGPMAKRTGSQASAAALIVRQNRHLRNQVFKTYAEAVTHTRGGRGALQAHHLLERRHFRALGPFSGEIGEIPAVILSRKQHQLASCVICCRTRARESHILENRCSMRIGRSIPQIS